MHALPLLIALVSGALLAGPVLRALSEGGHVRPNYRGRRLPSPFGVLPLATALLALVPLMLVQRFGPLALFHSEVLPVALYAFGVGLLGLIDDTLGGPRTDSDERANALGAGPRGWRGHGAALMRGEFTTGVLKAVGSFGLALLAMSYLGLSNGRWLLAAGVLVLATNVFNLLDLRPGRAIKAFVLVGVSLVAGAGELRPLWSLGLFATPALVAGLYDLRERAMLGDTGANLLGALAGLWLVLSLSGTGQLIALAVLGLITIYGELRSISAFIERIPVLRELDSWGRPS